MPWVLLPARHCPATSMLSPHVALAFSPLVLQGIGIHEAGPLHHPLVLQLALGGGTHRMAANRPHPGAVRLGHWDPQ